MVGPGGLEPPTNGLWVHFSYIDIYKNIDLIGFFEWWPIDDPEEKLYYLSNNDDHMMT